VLKTAALPDLAPNEEVEVVEYHYYGEDGIKAGDEAFLWFSGPNQRLAWSAEVNKVRAAQPRQTHRDRSVGCRDLLTLAFPCRSAVWLALQDILRRRDSSADNTGKADVASSRLQIYS
jgi:hypothetical protein